MTKKEIESTNDLLKLLNMSSLSQGTNTGINTITCMLSLLALTARPLSYLVTTSGRKLGVTTSFVITGSQSSRIYNDDIASQTSYLQNNYIEHLRRQLQIEIKQKAAAKPNTHQYPTGPKDSASEQYMSSTQEPDPFSTRSNAQALASALQTPPNPQLEDQARNPKIILSTESGADLMRQATGLHMNSPVVNIGLHPTSCSPKNNTVFKSFHEGRYSPGSDGEIIKANFMVMDSQCALAGLLDSTQDTGSWLDGLVMLPDGNYGPQLDPESSTYKPYFKNIKETFRGALVLAIGQRLDNMDQSSLCYKVDFTDAQLQEWSDFLLEVDVPGISGAAKNLPFTLAFGLKSLFAYQRAQQDLPAYLPLALAKYLVTRHSNARQAMVFDKVKQHRLALQASILDKLAEGPHDVRKITRRYNKLPAALCRELLTNLQAQGQVHEAEPGTWELTETKNLTLDI